MTAAKLCGGKTRAGGKCQKERGWGTNHPGSGRCKFHGGSSPNGQKAAAKEVALKFAAGALGAAVAGSPLDAMQEAVDLSRGLVSWYRHELAAAAAKIGTPDEAAGRQRIGELRGDYEAAIKLEATVSQAAIVSNVAERRQRIAEVQGEIIAAVLISAARAVFGDDLTADRQRALALEVGRRFEQVEDQPGLPVIEGKVAA